MQINSYTLAQIARFNDETISEKNRPEEIRYLDTSSITKNKIESFQNLRSDLPSRAKRKVKNNTIIYSTVRPNQEHYGIFEDIENENNIIVSTGFATIDVFSKDINPKFLFYKLTQRHIVDYLHTIGEGGVSAYPSINPSDIANLSFQFPNLPTQQKIASVLSALDDKIELNNKINAELEAMAKTLYDYWFVQFDFPDANSRPYKSSGGEMEYNEVLNREIPKGWEVKSLGAIANITIGQSPEGSSYNDAGEGMIFYQGSTDFGWRFPTVRQFTTKPTRFARVGDILLSVRAPVGTFNVAKEDCCIGRGLSALNSRDNFSSFLLYQMSYFKKKFDNINSVGTTFGSITKDDLHSLILCYPTSTILRQFEEIVSTFDKKIFINSRQNQELTSLRDWLLPMLMNGQVTVAGAYKEVEEKLAMVAEPRGKYRIK